MCGNAQKGIKSFELFVVVNGLNQMNVSQHSIEDHLIFYALKNKDELKLNLDNFSEMKSKDIWLRIQKKIDLTVFYSKLLDQVEDIFPQQYYALTLLES